MRLKVLLVDDEALARRRLASLLADCVNPEAEVLGGVSDAVAALEFVAHHRVDLVLADIHLPGADGLALAQALRAAAAPPAVVFVTAFAEHAVQAFDLSVSDYLTKPVRLERLQAALQKVAAQRALRAPVSDTAPSQAVLVIQQRGGLERVPLQQVLYLKAELKYITVRSATHSYLLEASLAELETRFADYFVRIHRNALVARRALRSLARAHDAQLGEVWLLHLDGIDEALLVSRRQLTLVRDLLGRADG